MNKQSFIKKPKTYIFWIIGLIVFSVAAQTSAAQTKDEIAVTNVLTQTAAAVENKDLEKLDKLWANDETTTVFEGGYADYGWLNYRNKHLARELKEFANLKYSFSDIKVKTDGKTAWAMLKYSLVADIGERHVDSAGLATAVLEKLGGRWQIVHWHSSASY